MNHDIIIVGGGASGIMCSILCKDMGLDVAILEGTDRIGKKILTTGNGRCNITNENISPLRYHSSNKNFFNNTLEHFSLKDTISFFNSIGIYLTTLDDGKMYPMSLQASSVVDLFRLAIEDRNIPVYTEHKVSNITKKNNFKLHCTNDEIFTCNKLVISTGGKSYSKTGSDGSGFKLAQNLGHSLIKPVPAIVQLMLNYKKLKAISGVKFDGNATIFVDNKISRIEFGEILFTDYGISGPPILQLSRIASYNLSKGKSVYLSIDLMPNFTKESLTDFIENHFGINSYRSVCDTLIGIIHKKLIPIILKECNIDDIHKPCWALDWQERLNIINLLKGWKFEVTGTKSFDNAQVTAGGIDTNDINSSTLESKLIPNLYFCGEVLDVDGDCGGFNLQWAWSSGAVAANSLKNS